MPVSRYPVPILAVNDVRDQPNLSRICRKSGKEENQYSQEKWKGIEPVVYDLRS